MVKGMESGEIRRGPDHERFEEVSGLKGGVIYYVPNRALKTKGSLSPGGKWVRIKQIRGIK